MLHHLDENLFEGISKPKLHKNRLILLIYRHTGAFGGGCGADASPFI